MSNTLGIIQKLHKIGKILSKIVFICCTVGFGLSIAGLISSAAGFEALKFGDITIKSILKYEADVSLGTVYTTLAVGLILCAEKAVLAKFAEHYFKCELANGTPFNIYGAKLLLMLGILTISVSLGSQIIAEIVHSSMSYVFENTADLSLNSGWEVALGIMFIITSLLCRYGAEKQTEFNGQPTNS